MTIISENIKKYIRANNPELSEEEVMEKARIIAGDSTDTSEVPEVPEVPEVLDTPEVPEVLDAPQVTHSEITHDPDTGTAREFMEHREEQWSDRIVDFTRMSPEELTANDLNWRRHPDLQVETMRSALSTLGVIQSIIFNRTTGKLVDGHLRLALAIEDGQKTLPVTIVELSEEEEKLALASYDPLSAMAVADAAKFQELVDSMGHINQDGALKDLIDGMQDSLGLLADADAQTLEDLQEEYGFDETDDVVDAYWPNVVVKQVDPDIVTRFEFLLKAANGNTEGEKFGYLVSILERDIGLRNKAVKLQAAAESNT